MVVKINTIPCLPTKLDVGDLTKNGTLLSDEEIKWVKNNLHVNGIYRYVEENHVKHRLKYAVLVQDGKYFAIYYGVKKNYLLGDGGFARVKLAQDIDTCEWSALKVQALYSACADKLITPQKESEEAAKGGLTVNIVSTNKPVTVERYSESKKKYQHYLLLKYVAGMDDICDDAQLSSFEWLDLSVKILQAVKKIHQNNMLHRDIKIENIRYDRSTGIVVVLDYGFAADMNESRVVIRSVLVGTPLQVAPELIHVEKCYAFTEKTDSYALGSTLGQMLDLVEEHQINIKKSSIGDYVTVYAENDSRLNNNVKITNVEVRKNIRLFIEKMLLSDPKCRPDIDAAIAFFKNEKQKIKPKDRVMNVAILDVNDYEISAKDSNSFEDLICALQEFDQIVLTACTEQKNDPLYHAKIKQELEKNNIAVSDQLYTGTPVSDLLQYVKSKVTADRPEYVCQFTCVKGGKLSKVDDFIKAAEVKKPVVMTMDKNLSNSARITHGFFGNIMHEMRKIGLIRGKAGRDRVEVDELDSVSGRTDLSHLKI